MMRTDDILTYALRALRAYPTRTLLMLLAMAIGVAAVVVLTALGDGARRYVTGEFATLGTHLLIVLPGRSQTPGGAPPVLGATPRDLTLEDAQALLREREIRRVAPLNVGAAPLSFAGREREAVVLGTTAEFLEVRNLEMAQGRFLPVDDWNRAQPVCVLGQKLREELFGATPAVGAWVRLGDRRFRVIGVLGSSGVSIGTDLSEVALIPVATAQALFNTPSLFRIMVEARSRAGITPARDAVRRILRTRHEGEDDVTVITQDAVLATFDRVLRALTLGVAGIAAISLGVAGILIMNVMLVAVSQRTAEIGLLKALGAPARAIHSLFLSEAAVLSLAGAGIGLAIGQLGSWLIGRAYPQVAGGAPGWAIIAAVGVALVTGVLFAVLPARRAARLDPVRALARR